MKKELLIIGLTIFSFTLLHAQKKYYLGIRGGINFSNMTTGDSYEKSGKTGTNIGLLAEISFCDKFSIQTEILFSIQGANTHLAMDGVPYPGNPSILPISAEYKFNYVQIPVLAKVYLIKKLSFEIGPSFNFLTKGEQTSELYTAENIGNKFEFSGILGLSYKINKRIFVSSRYFRGFSNVLKSNELYYFGQAKNFGFQLDMGYLF
jgi:hypothetical protein